MWNPNDYNQTPHQLRYVYRDKKEHPYYNSAKYLASRVEESYWRWVWQQLVAEVMRLHDQNTAEAYKADSTGSTAVDANYHWLPMNTCPTGTKVQLLGGGGVAVYGQYTGKSDDDFWAGWAPLPTKKEQP